MIPKTMGKHSEIRSGAQLEAALAAVRAELSVRRGALEDDYAALKHRFAPVNTAAGFLERGKNIIAWSTAALSLLRAVRGRRR